jgi:hypothetical protein
LGCLLKYFVVTFYDRLRQGKMSALTPRPGAPSTSLQRLHHVEKV